MSLKVHRNSTTMSFSFLMGAMWRSSHSGVPVRQVLVVVELVSAAEGVSGRRKGCGGVRGREGICGKDRWREEGVCLVQCREGWR